jgi:vacuolar iron transporter family protein
MIRVKRFAFGATAAVMTSMALIVGLGTANTGKASIIAGLLIIGVADNLSDALGIHIHEESEVEGKTEAFGLAVSNYITRFLVVCSFILIVLLLSPGAAHWVGMVWGVVLLSMMTYFIAQARAANPAREIAIHLVVAATIVALSQGIGYLIKSMT